MTQVAEQIDYCFRQAHEGNPRPFMESFLKVRDKANNLIPFTFSRILDYIDSRITGSDLICKPRQVFLSTYDLARAFTYVFCVPYYQAACLSDHKDSNTRLFRTVIRFYDNLPPEVQRLNPLKRDRMDVLEFEETDSIFYIGTAGNREFGRSETINFLIISEEAHYSEAAQELVLPSALGAVANIAGGITVRESTPNGIGNSFHEAYVKGKAGAIPWAVTFVPWFWHFEYKYPVEHHKTLPADRISPLTLTEEEEIFIQMAKTTFDITITEEQIRFRRSAKTEFGHKFAQEYPENDVSCWLATQEGVFNPERLEGMLNNRVEVFRTGDSLDPPIRGLQIFKLPEPWATYSVGSDVAEGLPGGDYSCSQVLHDQTGEQVAVLWGHMPVDEFTKRSLRLAELYNHACLGIERGIYGEIAIRVAQYEIGYNNLFKYRDPGEPVTSAIVGFPTNVYTKEALLINKFASAIESNDVRINDPETIREVLEFKKYRDGRYGAPQNRHDDRAMSAMIAHHVRLNKPNVPTGRRGLANRGTGSAILRPGNWP